MQAQVISVSMFSNVSAHVNPYPRQPAACLTAQSAALPAQSSLHRCGCLACSSITAGEQQLGRCQSVSCTCPILPLHIVTYCVTVPHTHCPPQLLHYRADLFARYGLAVPRTWHEFLGLATNMTGVDVDGSGQPFYGVCWEFE